MTGWPSLLLPLLLVIYLAYRWTRADDHPTPALFLWHLSEAVLGYTILCLMIYGIIYWQRRG